MRNLARNIISLLIFRILIFCKRDASQFLYLLSVYVISVLAYFAYMPTRSKNKSILLTCFGQIVRANRFKLNLSQQSLANRSGFHLTYIGDLELGGRNIALKNIARLAVALESTPENLMKQWLAQLEKEQKGFDLKIYFSEHEEKKERK